MNNIARVLYNVNLSTQVGAKNPCNCDEIKMVVWCGLEDDSNPSYGVMLCNATADEDGNDHPPCKIANFTMVEGDHASLEDAMRDFDTLCANVLAARLFEDEIDSQN